MMIIVGIKKYIVRYWRDEGMTIKHLRNSNIPCCVCETEKTNGVIIEKTMETFAICDDCIKEMYLLKFKAISGMIKVAKLKESR